MLQSRHRRERSHQSRSERSLGTSHGRQGQQPSLPDSGVIEWSKTTSRACSRLLPSLQPIFNRGEEFTGVAGDSYGLLLSNDHAFIFPYTNTSVLPPILTFPLPPGESWLLGALIPGSGNEPGLLVVMPTSGRIGYWPALHSALAPTAGLEARFTLGGGEYVSKICNAGTAGLVLATSTGRMVHVSLRDVAGKAVVNLSVMSSTSGWLSALKSVATRKEIVALRAGAAQSREERQIHSVTKRGGLTIWEVSRGGNYRIILDCDLWPLLADKSVAEVLDVVAYPVESNAILLLTKSQSRMTQILVIAFDTAAQPSLMKAIDLPAMESPTIHLPNPGNVAFVQTRTSIHMVWIARDTIEAIKMQSDVTIVATGVEDQLKNKRNPALVLLTNGAGVIRIEAFIQSTAPQDPVKAKLEQAVFYGSLPNNPISFMPAPSHTDIAARELSKEILDGSSLFLPHSVAIKDALDTRIKASQALVAYIGHDVKATTLQVLREHVEKLAAGRALWIAADARIDSASILPSLIPTSQEAVPGSDTLRSFFLHRLSGIVDVVMAAHRACIQAAAVMGSQALSHVVQETDDIMLATLSAAVEYRDAHPEYGTTGTYWTSEASILQILVVQLSITQRLVVGLKQDDGNDLRDQVVGLTTLNCRLSEDYLHSVPSTAAEYTKISQKYLGSRPEWLKNLVRLGRLDQALEIGQTFRDFQTLIEICHDQGEMAKDEEVIESVVRRLEWYLHTFKYDFATVLWEYYISHRQVWNLLHEFPTHRDYLTKFFADGRYPNISWMNDVMLGDFDRAGATLLEIPEVRIEKRKIQLSIAKLAILVNHDNVPNALEEQIKSSRVMDRMMHELTNFAHTAIDSTAGIEMCCMQFIPKLHRNPERPKILRRHLTSLLDGRTLSAGAAIDYLTSKTSPNFIESLVLLNNSARLPVSVHEFLENLVWRRCFIADDWMKLVDTSGLSDAAIKNVSAQTNLFLTMKACYAQTPSFRIKAPSEVYFVDHQVVPFPGLTSKEVGALKQEYAAENEVLDKYEAHANLATWFSAIRSIAQKAVTEDLEEYVTIEHGHDADDVFMAD